MAVVNYSIIKTPCITDEEYNNYSDFIYETLTDPRGWSKFGYIFKRASNNSSDAIKVRFLTDKDMINKFDKSIKGLSAYYPFEHAVYFNLHNWNNGTWEGLFPSKDNEDGLTRYRQYVVNHEFGHALGLEHPKCKEGQVSVMEQNTKGLSWLNRCRPNNKKDRMYNCWPLDKEIYDEERGDGNNKLRYKYKGGSGSVSNINNLYIKILISTIVLYVLLMILCKTERYISSIKSKFLNVWNKDICRKSGTYK